MNEEKGSINLKELVDDLEIIPNADFKLNLFESINSPQNFMNS